MHRGNRKFLVTSTLLVLPAALLMASLSGAAPPSKPGASEKVASDGKAEPSAKAKSGVVAHAVGTGNESNGQIQQVAGKQPTRRRTRPGGLLNALTGNQSGGSESNRSTGLLGGLFNSGSTSKSQSTPHTRPTPPPEPANWDGIPFHQVNGSSKPKSSGRTPIADPSEGSFNDTASTGGTRIIRGGSARTLQAQPASSRRQVAGYSDPAPRLSVPQPVPEVRVEKSSSPALSSTSSSRRSGRRNVQALNASEIAAAAKKPRTTSSQKSSASDDLVPKVARRQIEKPKTAEVAKSQSKTASASKSATLPSAPTPTLAPAPSKPGPSEPSTALAAISPPATATPRTTETPSANLGAPSATLSVPARQPADPYNTASEPLENPGPIAGVPSHPYATKAPATTPSLPVAHRSGPPRSAFGPAPVTEEPSYDRSAPVGSGIVARGEVATYRRHATGTPQTNTDPYQTHQRAPAPPSGATYPQGQTFGQAQPYGQGQARAHGQPYPSAPNYQTPYRQPGDQYADSATGQYGQPSERVAIRPAHQDDRVPMQPIGAYQPDPRAIASPAQPAPDNFAAAATNSRLRPEIQSAPGLTAVASELPGIRVITNGPSEVMIRQTNQYEIRVENRGSIDATGVMIRTIVPEWADLRGQNATAGDVDSQTQDKIERLVWKIDHLPAGGTERLFVQLKAGRSGTFELDVDWTLLPQKSVAKVQVHEPKLGLSIDGPDEVVYGQSQTYRVRVLNPGDGTAPNVVFTLSPNSATPQTQRVGDIPPGKEAQFEVELTAQDLGDLKIHGLASGDLELRAEASKTIRVSSAKLEAMLSGPELKYQNTESMYRLQVQNTGTATSEKIMASLRLPAGVKYLGGIQDAELRGNRLLWQVATLAPGATRDYQFRCNMTATGDQLFSFDCRGSAAGETDVTISTRVESIADLVLTVSDPVAPAPIGSDVTYEIIVRNRGSKEATEVTAVAQFSHGIEPLRIEGHSGEVVTGQVLFDTIPRIGPGQEIKLRVIAQAERAGHHRFRTEISSGDTVLVAEEATHYMSPTGERVSRRSTDDSNR